VIFGLIWGIPFVTNLTLVNQRYDVVLTVQSVEKSTHWGDHTNIYVQLYGEQKVYALKGFWDLEVGKTYHIVFVDELAVFGFAVWGNVELLEEVTNAP